MLAAAVCIASIAQSWNISNVDECHLQVHGTGQTIVLRPSMVGLLLGSGPRAPGSVSAPVPATWILQ